MPFILTCDHCRAKLRTAARLPDGRKVRCTKCGEPFAVGAANQRDANAPAWEVVEDESAAKPPARRAAVAADDEDDRPRKKARARPADDEDEEDRPRKKGKGRDRAKPAPSRLYLWVGGGLAVTLLVGVGLFFALRKGDQPAGPGGGTATGGGDGTGGGGGGGEESYPGYRPRRPLSKDLLVYWPGEPFGLSYSTFTRPPADGGTTRPPFVADEVRKLGVAPEQVSATLYCTRNTGGETVSVYELKSAFDLPAAAAKEKYAPIPVAGGTIFHDRGRLFLQPKPTVVVFWDLGPGGLGLKTPPTKDAEDLLRRGPGDSKITDEMWEVLQGISGYPYVSIRRAGGDIVPITAKYRFEAGAETETLTGWLCNTPRDAQNGEAAFRKLEESIAKDPLMKAKMTRYEFSVRGDRLYRYVKRPVPPPKP